MDDASDNAAKRLFDLAAASTLLIVVAPLYLAIAALIRIREGKPVYFRQTRIGRNCQPFCILKFRTMRVESGQTVDLTGHRAPSASLNDISKPQQVFTGTQQNDPRITSTGRWLRRTHLDELPQLINVLRGDMSIVGPRPDTPAQTINYLPQHWRRRHRVRPGMTGLAQIVPNRAASPRSRTALDLLYMRKRSLNYDLRILALTVLKVIKADSF